MFVVIQKANMKAYGCFSSYEAAQQFVETMPIFGGEYAICQVGKSICWEKKA